MEEGGGVGVCSRETPSGSGPPLCEREALLSLDGCVFVPARVCDNPEIEEGFSDASASPQRLSHVRTTNCSWKEKLNSLKVLLLFHSSRSVPVIVP